MRFKTVYELMVTILVVLGMIIGIIIEKLLNLDMFSIGFVIFIFSFIALLFSWKHGKDIDIIENSIKEMDS